MHQWTQQQAQALAPINLHQPPHDGPIIFLQSCHRHQACVPRPLTAQAHNVLLPSLPVLQNFPRPHPPGHQSQAILLYILFQVSLHSGPHQSSHSLAQLGLPGSTKTCPVAHHVVQVGGHIWEGEVRVPIDGHVWCRALFPHADGAGVVDGVLTHMPGVAAGVYEACGEGAAGRPP
mgnify:CR=1 FL=1